jgi:hypothetical protein
MKWRPLKWFRHAFVFGALAVMLLILQVIVLPRVVQNLIISKLTEIGLPDSSLEVRSCSWRSAEISNVSLSDRCCGFIGAMTVHYSPISLIQGKFKQIQIVGGRLQLQFKDGQIGLEKAVKLKASKGEPLFDLVELSACEIAIEWAQKQIPLLCDGSISHADDGRMAGDLTLNLHGIPLHAQFASSGAEPELSFSVEKEAVDLRTLLTVLPNQVVELPPRRTDGHQTCGIRLQTGRDQNLRFEPH